MAIVTVLSKVSWDILCSGTDSALEARDLCSGKYSEPQKKDKRKSHGKKIRLWSGHFNITHVPHECFSKNLQSIKFIGHLSHTSIDPTLEEAQIQLFSLPSPIIYLVTAPHAGCRMVPFGLQKAVQGQALWCTGHLVTVREPIPLCLHIHSFVQQHSQVCSH